MVCSQRARTVVLFAHELASTYSKTELTDVLGRHYTGGVRGFIRVFDDQLRNILPTKERQVQESVKTTMGIFPYPGRGT